MWLRSEKLDLIQIKKEFFLTESGFLAEGITSNLFWVKDEVLYTPSLETGILNGITRQFILTLAEQLMMQVQEGLYLETTLLEAEEIFFTNSIQEIVPVIQLGQKIYPGKKGYIVQKLNQMYQEYVHTYWKM